MLLTQSRACNPHVFWFTQEGVATWLEHLPQLPAAEAPCCHAHNVA